MQAIAFFLQSEVIVLVVTVRPCLASIYMLRRLQSIGDGGSLIVFPRLTAAI